MTVVFSFIINLICHTTTWSVFFRGVFKATHAVELLFSYELQQLFELLLSFTRETNDELRTDDCFWQVFADVHQSRFNFITSHFAIHAFQNRIVHVLKWHIEVTNNLFAVLNNLNHFLRDAIWIQVHQANPLKTFNLVQSFQKLNWAFFASWILATDIETVISKVMADDDKFFNAASNQKLRLSNDGVDRARL